MESYHYVLASADSQLGPLSEQRIIAPASLDMHPPNHQLMEYKLGRGWKRSGEGEGKGEENNSLSLQPLHGSHILMQNDPILL